MIRRRGARRAERTDSEASRVEATEVEESGVAEIGFDAVGADDVEAFQSGAPSSEQIEPGTGVSDREERPSSEADAGEDEATAPRLRGRLGRARASLAAPFTALRQRGRLDDAMLAELEEGLLLADVGLSTTTRLLSDLKVAVDRRDAPPPIQAFRDLVTSMFADDDPTLRFGEPRPTVWLFVGVNGVGKTTTIGKLARREQTAGRRVVVAAGDTFRAAAVEQLATWAEASGADLVRGAEGADPSSVIFDAITHARASATDLVLADTAGRLHTKSNLMAELQKVRRVADRAGGSVTEVLLVLDATTGQNGLAQAREFAEAVDVTGIVLTKLDGSAKGGIVLAIRSELGIPIKLVGLGEGIGDLARFDAAEFAHELVDGS